LRVPCTNENLSHARSVWWLGTNSYAPLALESRPPPSGLGDNPERKDTPCFLDLAGDAFLKKERVFFSFGVLQSKYSGSAAGPLFARTARNGWFKEGIPRRPRFRLVRKLLDATDISVIKNHRSSSGDFFISLSGSIIVLCGKKLAMLYSRFLMNQIPQPNRSMLYSV